MTKTMIEWGNIEDYKVLQKEINVCGQFYGKIWRITKDKKLLAIINFSVYDRDVEVDLWSQSPDWLSRSLIRKFFSYCFNELKCVRISASTSKSNVKTRKLLENLGFKWEGTRRIAMKGENQLDYGILKDECKWLKRSKENGKKTKST